MSHQTLPNYGDINIDSVCFDLALLSAFIFHLALKTRLLDHVTINSGVLPVVRSESPGLKILDRQVWKLN